MRNKLEVQGQVLQAPALERTIGYPHTVWEQKAEWLRAMEELLQDAATAHSLPHPLCVPAAQKAGLKMREAESLMWGGQWRHGIFQETLAAAPFGLRNAVSCNQPFFSEDDGEVSLARILREYFAKRDDDALIETQKKPPQDDAGNPALLFDLPQKYRPFDDVIRFVGKDDPWKEHQLYGSLSDALASAIAIRDGQKDSVIGNEYAAMELRPGISVVEQIFDGDDDTAIQDFFWRNTGVSLGIQYDPEVWGPSRWGTPECILRTIEVIARARRQMQGGMDVRWEDVATIFQQAPAADGEPMTITEEMLVPQWQWFKKLRQLLSRPFRRNKK